MSEQDVIEKIHNLPWNAYEEVHDILKNVDQTPAICMAAVEHSSSALEHVENQSEDICLAAVRHDGVTLKYVRNQTENICLAAVKSRGQSLMFVKEQTEKICLAAVKRYGIAIKYVENQTQKICLAAVKSDGLAIQYSKFRDDDICLAAVRNNGLALQFVEHKSAEICLEAVSSKGEALKYVKEQSPEICLAAVSQDGLAIEYIEKQTEEMCLIAIKRAYVDSVPFILRHIHNQTPEICFAAVKKNGLSLEYVNVQTPEICTTAFSKCTHKNRYEGFGDYKRILSLVKDKTEIVYIEVIKRAGPEYLYDLLKNLEQQSTKICMAAVKKYGTSLEYVREKTPEICIAAVRNNPLAIKYVDEQTLELCKLAVKSNNKEALKYIDRKKFNVNTKFKNRILIEEKDNLPQRVNEIVFEQKTEFSNKSVCVTGKLFFMTRKEAQNILIDLGAKISSSISSKTDLIIVGDKPGSKLEKSIELSIPSMTENEMIKIFKKHNYEIDDNYFLLNGKPLIKKKDKIQFIKNNYSLESIPFNLIKPSGKIKTNSYIGKGVPLIENTELIDKGYYPYIQIDFSELVDSIDKLPQNGIFQLWLKDSDYNDYVSVYHDDTKSLTEYNEIQWHDAPEFHILFNENIVHIAFEKIEINLPYFLSDIIPEQLRKDDDVFNYLSKNSHPSAHFMLGHPDFCQDDPNGAENIINLLQLDSDFTVMIGDCGTFHLFMTEEELAHRDFSNVQIYWDTK